MAITLNLLPPEEAVGKNLSKVLKSIRAIGVIAIAGFIIFVVGVSGFFVFSYLTLKNSQTIVADLESQIKTREVSEQQIVLLKDRIQKIASAQKSPSSMKNLGSVEPYIKSMSGESQITEMGADSKKVTITVNFKSNSELSSFLKNMTGSTVFKTVALSSFAFNPATGYALGVDIQSK